MSRYGICGWTGACTNSSLESHPAEHTRPDSQSWIRTGESPLCMALKFTYPEIFNAKTNAARR
jgi:hypothetical protein